MKLKNPLSKKKPHPITAVSKPKVKKDWFDSGVITIIGLMIGSLIAYIIITNGM